MPRKSPRSIFTNILLAVLCISVLLQAGCAPKLPPEPAWEQAATSLLDQADALYSRRQYDQATKVVNSFLFQYPQSRHRDRAFFLLGEIRFTLRDYARALKYYKDIIQEFPASSFIIDAKYKLGLCYFEIKDYDSAAANLADRGKITDPERLRRIAEILSFVYGMKQNYPLAVKEYVYLVETARNEQQKAGYRDRVRELIEKNMTEQELRALAVGSAYPADIAQLRLAGLLFEQKNYRDAISISKSFLDKFPAHPEKTRAEMTLNEATSRLAGPRYSIAALLPQSGQLAFFGDRALKGIQLAVYTYNLQDPDNRVELIIKDTEGSPEKAVAALTELASKGIIAAIGPLLTKEAEALVPTLDKARIPVITPAASGEGVGKLSPWLFRNALTNSSQATAAAQYALGLKLKKFVLLYPDDAYGKDLARLFTNDLERKAEILASVSYPSDVKDFGPYIRKIMEIDLRSRKILIPDDDAERKKLLQDFTPSFGALYLPGHADKVGLLIPNLAYYNIKDVAIIGSNDWHSPDLVDRAERHADGAVFTDGFFPESTDPVIKSFVSAYRSAYQEDPDILSAQAYDAAMMVFSLIKEHKNTPVAIRDGLLAMKGYHGISGDASFFGNGEAQKTLFLIKVQDGKFVLNTGDK
jgi:ABC-type branched-subunit amino acid transport system substrate-binding protein